MRLRRDRKREHAENGQREQNTGSNVFKGLLGFKDTVELMA